jgi:GrpB-like predicted nucleotidyltransferase (UPF0157 family)
MAPRLALSPPNPVAPLLFAREAERVGHAIPSASAVEHVGSTAVPGLAGKPTIDIAVGVPTLGPRADYAGMEALGYAYGGDQGRPQHVFRKGEGVPWRFLVHVVEHDGRMWRDYLTFRDHLRKHPEDVRTYENLKRNLLNGREGWYSGRDKDAFIASILAGADPGTVRRL